jgi:eukaryotic-like serine/threonine-protein kinase
MSASPIAEHLERILSSPAFEGATRSKALLKFVVEQSIANQTDQLKEYTLGTEALGRDASFDPRTDPIVRAEVSRLRSRLERYYAADGQADQLMVVLPKGSYVPQFVERKAPETAGTPPARGRDISLTRRTGVVAGAVVAGMLIFSLGRFFPASPPQLPEAPLAQFDVELKSRGEINGWVSPAVTIAQDGTRLVFASIDPDGATRLNWRRLDEAQTAELPGTEGARVAFFSPDGRWVGFWASGKLKKTPLDGGSPLVLCDLIDINGAGWGEDDSIIAAVGSTLLRIPGSGGTPKIVLDLARESARPAWPQILPGGKMVLFTAIGYAGPDHATIEALSLETGKRQVLARDGTFGRYLPGPYLTYVNQRTLFAVPLNLAGMKVRGAAVPVLEGVAYSSTFGYADLDFSRTGVLVYRKNSGAGVVAQWRENGGKSEAITKPGNYLWPRVSPDGKRLALSVAEGGETGLWIYDVGPERHTRSPLVTGQYASLWTPDGKYLVLGSTRGGLSWLPGSGTGTPQALTSSPRVQVPWSFMPDGSRLAYHEANAATGFDLWTVPIQESAGGLTAGTPEIFLRTPAFETYPTFSPDGHWIAYGSNESGTWEVYVRSFPDNGTKVQVSRSGGRIPHWSPQRRELLYRTDDQRIMTADYAVRAEKFVVESIRPWSQIRLADTGVLSNFDFGPDGRLAALMPAENAGDRRAGNEVTFMLNFPGEVRRRVGAPGK